MTSSRHRALAALPGTAVPSGDVVLFALGVAAAVTVAVSAGEQLVRVLFQQRPPALSGEALAEAVGVAVAVIARGADRAALWVAAISAASLVGTFVASTLTYAYVARSILRDPLAQVGPAFGSLVLGAVTGLAIRIVIRGLLPPLPRASGTSALFRTIGVAIVAGTVVHLLCPTGFFLAVSEVRRPDDPRGVLLQLPELLAGPIAAGIYAARNGVGYLALLTLGALLAIPSALVEIAILRGAAEVGDPALRGAFALGSALLILRIAAWPLAAAFANGFLLPPRRA